MSQKVFAPWDDPNEKPLIRFQGVTKRFGAFTAIDDLSLDIYEQEFFALLGPVGLRQDHDDADAGRVRGADRAARSCCRGRTSRRCRRTSGR